MAANNLCLNCQSIVDPNELGKYSSGKFCSISCARLHVFRFEDKNKTKKTNCNSCGLEIEVNKRSDLSKVKCKKCKEKRKEKAHLICGKPISNCKQPDICKKNQLIPTLSKYFGFDESTLGSENALKEFERIRNKVHHAYWIKKLSIPELMEKFNYDKDPRDFSRILNSLEITKREKSESVKNAYLKRSSTLPTNYHYKCGWHETWDKKQVFYRSSYELSYAQYLDEQQINYEMEDIRIEYWDSQKMEKRVAIPDFYLPNYNLIVEIKSNYTFDENNMKDKKEAYLQNGYNFKLILDKQEFEI